MWRQVWRLGSLVTMMVASLLLQDACSRDTAPVQIRSAVSQLPQTLDQRYATDAASARVNRLFRFTLGQHGRHFHDGRYLTAEDVAATYQSILELADSTHAAEFANISKIEVRDENTLDFFLNDADSNFPSRLIPGILPAELIARQHDFSNEPVGSGPFKFVSWQRSLKLERGSDRKRFVFEEIRDPTVRVLKLVRGDTDILQGDLPPELVSYLQKQPGLQV